MGDGGFGDGGQHSRKAGWRTSRVIRGIYGSIRGYNSGGKDLAGYIKFRAGIRGREGETGDSRGGGGGGE